MGINFYRISISRNCLEIWWRQERKLKSGEKSLDVSRHQKITLKQADTAAASRQPWRHSFYSFHGAAGCSAEIFLLNIVQSGNKAAQAGAGRHISYSLPPPAPLCRVFVIFPCKNTTCSLNGPLRPCCVNICFEDSLPSGLGPALHFCVLHFLQFNDIHRQIVSNHIEHTHSTYILFCIYYKCFQ